ncbi:hypothetical protein [Polynucleobacter sp. AP-Kolm-20A-A1]|uniref:hypothetical protein n=1 Tax=Polynucleobacter sp. AP-Kolm-20A-A1 TaxID=2081041 RepID=UPI001BFD1729|nr:hypothetical protein [Polynucleobacter sp. AP-Kolm-20A-A1]QWE20878.1 hypothetical protein C2745_01410 [Polynucleobacter sp. AP-Kolm-20A-A1]
MILAWVISLLLLGSALVGQLERLATLRIVEVNSIKVAHAHFVVSEKAVLQCEGSISNLSALVENHCFIEPAGKNLWRITSKEKPFVQIHVRVDEKSGLAKRLNWRQVFE